MKRILALIAAVLILIGSAAMATEVEDMTNEEQLSLIAQLQQELAELKGEKSQIEPEAAPEDMPEPVYTEIARGAKGEEVKPIQQRLKDLGYLTGSVDGDFGGGTERAVSAFQSQHKIPVTGVADVETQEILFSDAAQKSIVYEKLEYKGVSRNPDEYEGRYVKFNGEVLQVIEGDYMIAFLIYANSDYDQLLRVEMYKPEDYSRFLEDDLVEVRGKYDGLYSYKTVRGNTNTIPLIDADLVTLR